MNDPGIVFALNSMDRSCGKTCPLGQGTGVGNSQNGTAPAAKLGQPPWSKSREFWSAQAFLISRVIQTRITAPTNATIIEPISPLSGQM